MQQQKQKKKQLKNTLFLHVQKSFDQIDSSCEKEWPVFNLRYWVAVDRKSGLIMGGAGMKPTPRQKKGTKKMVTVDCVFTVAQFRRKKIASTLMMHLEEYARQQRIQCLRLTTQTNLKGAVSLYQKLGFYELNKAKSRSGNITLVKFKKNLIRKKNSGVNNQKPEVKKRQREHHETSIENEFEKMKDLDNLLTKKRKQSST